MANKYKLRIYKQIGVNAGNLDHEEFFSSPVAMKNRYRELFVHDRFSLNPTAWIMRESGWERIIGY